MIAIADTIDVASRNLRSMLRMPQALVFALIQPVLFVLLFPVCVRRRHSTCLASPMSIT